ncbi:MAG TPA: two-component regulator propeller domain-containing protein [Chryseolinea sp.]|nr:two-component regulator propeller domain-containing protein [Chryseolinea sp.]
MREHIVRASLSLGLLLLVSVLAFAQDIKFNHITTNHGLANGNVRTILQDYQGFFWIGTEDGLQRYDGYSLIEYHHDPEVPSSISSNFIFCLYEDSKKNLWIGNLDGGLCWFNRKKNNFHCFKNDPDDPTSLQSNLVRSISETSDGTIYVGCKEGGFSYFKTRDTIPDNITFTNFAIPEIPNERNSSWVSDIIEDDDKSLVVAIIGSGLHRFNPVTKEFHALLRDSVSTQTQRLEIDSQNRLWISTWGDGLYVYDKATRRIAHHKAGHKQHQLLTNQIEGVNEDGEGNIWISTDNGLSFLHSKFDPFGYCQFINYTHNQFEPTSLLSNSIKAFYLDKTNRLWISSYYGGVNIYDKNASKFDAIRSKIWLTGSLSNNNVTSFAEDERGNLWIGTDGGGLNYLGGGISNIRKDQFRKIEIKLDEEDVFKIKSLQLDSEGNLWIGTWGSGLFKFNTHTKEYSHYGVKTNPSDGLTANQVMTLETDPLDNLWIGTYSGGLSYFNKKLSRFFHFPYLSRKQKAGKANIKSIHVDAKGRVWVAREVGGLNLYDSTTNSFKNIQNEIIKNDLTILSIYEDKAGTLWLGTNSSGMIHYNADNQATTLYNKKSGLVNNTIYAIQEDVKTGRLWLSSNKGLMEFDPVEQKVKSYNRSDGLQGNQYNPESSFQLSDGTLLFGGITGMDAFIPSKIETSSYIPPVVFTKFWVDNIETNVNDTLSVLEENIILAEKIDLEHTQNSFGIEFAILEYSFSDRNQYMYTLEGFNETWQRIGSERKVSFTNLNPGTYVFKVKASNSDGVWTPTEKVLKIIIHPAWWQTRLFKIFLIAAVLLILFSLVRIRVNYLIKQKRKLEKKVKARTYELKEKNDELKEKIEEIISQNDLLHKQTNQIVEKNNEIQSQNEELTTQNDQIILQRENLRMAEFKLKEANEQLEVLVEQRTKKLEETIQQLDKTVTELDRFVYSASHDLSAPLKSVLGLVQIARIEKDQERIEEYYHHIEFSVQKLDRVIKSMVEFSRNYHLDIHSEYFNFCDLVDEVLEELAFWPEARRISFRNTVAKDSALKSDNQRLKVVLHNLIGNSVKYADLTKDDSFLQIGYEKNDTSSTILISDNGMGIKQERQSRIFEMYYRATARSQGSGLGLFIVKEIILKLGGTIDVKSSLGHGTTFRIQIPDETHRIDE